MLGLLAGSVAKSMGSHMLEVGREQRAQFYAEKQAAKQRDFLAEQNRLGREASDTRSRLDRESREKIAKLSADTQIDVAAMKGKSGATTASLTRANKIAHWSSVLPDVSEADIMAIVDNKIKVVTNPQSGEIRVINTATLNDVSAGWNPEQRAAVASLLTDEGSTASAGGRPTTPAGTSVVRDEPPIPDTKPEYDPNADTLWNHLQRPGGVSGVVAGLKAMVDNIGGQVPGYEGVDFENLSIRKRFQVASTSMAQALSVNKNYPVKEFTRLIEEFGMDPSVGKSDVQIAAGLISINDFLKEKRDVFARIAADSSMPKKIKEEAEATVITSDAFIAQMGVPDDPELRKQMGGGGIGGRTSDGLGRNDPRGSSSRRRRQQQQGSVQEAITPDLDFEGMPEGFQLPGNFDAWPANKQQEYLDLLRQVGQ